MVPGTDPRGNEAQSSAPSLPDLTEFLDDPAVERRCRHFLEALRWSGGVQCPHPGCGSLRIGRVRTRRQFECLACGYQFSVTSGTVFHDSHLPLAKWFAAVHLMCETRNGVSARRMGRSLHVTYKTAWYLCHRIRRAMLQEVPPTPGAPQSLASLWPVFLAPRTESSGDSAHATPFLAQDQWLDLRRRIVEPFHQVGRKHFHAYASEWEWRLNLCQNPLRFRDTLASLLAAPRVGYRNLTHGDE